MGRCTITSVFTKDTIMTDLTGRAFARAYRPRPRTGSAVALACAWNPPRAPGSAGNRRSGPPSAPSDPAAPIGYLVALVALTLANFALVALCAMGGAR
jgi:hypothetical protein